MATTKKSAPKPATRKSSAKKANAPMKNSPASKSPKTKTKAKATKAARTMAKAVKPGIRKSAAMRVEKVEKKVSLAKQIEQADLAALKSRMNMIVRTLKADCEAAAKGKAGEKLFREELLAVTKTMVATKKKQGKAFA